MFSQQVGTDLVRIHPLPTGPQRPAERPSSPPYWYRLSCLRRVGSREESPILLLLLLLFKDGREDGQQAAAVASLRARDNACSKMSKSVRFREIKGRGEMSDHVLRCIEGMKVEPRSDDGSSRTAEARTSTVYEPQLL